jgi:hypothetical protein
MWKTTFRNRNAADLCSHDRVTTTANYGLRRTVCGNCGHVSVGYLNESVKGYADHTTQDSQLDAEEDRPASS